MGHRKRKTRFFTFMMVPDNERQAKSMKIKTGVMRFFIVSLVIIITMIVLGAVSYWKVASLALAYNDVQEENKRLKEGLGRMAEIESDLERLKKIDQKLRSSLSGYIALNKEGSSSSDEEALAKMDDLLGSTYSRSLFNSIPDIYPVEGFSTRGYEYESMLGDTHFGIDIASPKGTAVRATADGEVIFSGWTFEEGNIVIIKHSLDYYSFYKHNLRNLCQRWEYVKKGQIIALLGDTGRISSGPHLHFEIWQGTTPVDPEKILRKN